MNIPECALYSRMYYRQSGEVLAGNGDFTARRGIHIISGKVGTE